MGNVHLVTGYAGENHITASDMGSLFAAIIGNGEFVLNRGEKFAATVVTNNQIRVSDGDIMMQGRHIRMNTGSYVDLAIENGSAGYKRNDLIVARYTKNSGSGVEDCNLVVIKGTPSTSSPVDPAYTTGSIINGTTQNDMPLFRIPIDGINIQTLVPLFTAIDITMSVVQSELNDKVPDSRTVAGLSLASNITVQQLVNALSVVPETREIAGLALSGDITAAQLVSALSTIPISKGGTGATTGAAGLKNLFAAGITVLSSHQYGNTLPAAGTAGRIFFKKV